MLDITWNSEDGTFTYNLPWDVQYGRINFDSVNQMRATWPGATDHVTFKTEDFGVFKNKDIGINETWMGAYSSLFKLKLADLSGYTVSGTLVCSDQMLINMSNLTTNNNVALIRAGAGTGIQRLISSSQGDQILLGDDNTERVIEASHGDYIKAFAGSNTTLDFATYLNGSASSITVGATDEQSSLNFADDAKSVKLFNINQFVNVNELTISGADGSTVTGSAGDNTLTSHGDVTKLYGEDGNDDLTSYGVNSLLYGGEGADTITGHGEQNILRGEGGNDTVTSHGSRSSLYGGEGDDTMFSDGDNTNLRGGDNNDTVESHGDYALLHGDGGNDTLFSTGIKSQLYGDEGDDLFIVENVYFVDGGEGVDTLILSTQPDFDNVTIINIEILELEGDYDLMLSDANVTQMTDDNNALIIEGDSGDTFRYEEADFEYITQIWGYKMFFGENGSTLLVDINVNVIELIGATVDPVVPDIIS